MSLYNIDDVYFDEYYIDKTKENIKKLQIYLDDIKKEFNIINTKIKNNLFTFPSKLNENFKKEIDNYKEWFENIDKSDKEKYINELKLYSPKLKEHFNYYYNKIFSIYNSTFFKNVPQMNENIKNLIDSLGEYEKIEKNYSSDSSIYIGTLENNINKNYYPENINEKSENEFDDYENDYYDNNENQNKNEEILRCHADPDKEAVYYCTHCDQLFCERCRQGEINNLVHNFQELNVIKIENEVNKNQFIKNFMDLFKQYLLKCDCIIKYINKDTNDILISKMNYPTIKNEDFESQIEFFKNINDIYDKLEKKSKELSETQGNSFHEDKLSNFIKFSLKGQLDLNFSNLEYYDLISNEKYNQTEDDNNNENEFDKVKNQFFYIVGVVKKNNYDSGENEINIEIINLISEVLKIKKNNIIILENNKRTFINHFIKTELFWKISPKKMKKDYPNLNKLYEYKILIDGLIRYKCKISKEKLDYKYNFITPNLSLNNRRGKEIYIPPYGWFGIGLNVINKYDKGNNDWLNVQDKSGKWAICYYFFDKNLSSDEIMVKLNKVIMNNELFLDKSQIKMNEYNTRAKLKRIGTGYYLSYDINIAEKYTGIIYFGNKKFKILLMAKVLIESIKEPADKMFWIISKKEHIRIYRILLKEINN